MDTAFEVKLWARDTVLNSATPTFAQGFHEKLARVNGSKRNKTVQVVYSDLGKALKKGENRLLSIKIGKEEARKLSLDFFGEDEPESMDTDDDEEPGDDESKPKAIVNEE